MSDTKNITVLYDKDGQRIKPDSPDIIIIKQYIAFNDNGLIQITFTTIDNEKIGPCHMTYDSFTHLFLKGFNACATICNHKNECN